jgi:hypothetical protein
MKTFDCVIAVLDKGFVYHGNLVIEDDGWFTLTSVRNIRRFGTERGLGQLALTGPTKETVLDPCSTVRGTISGLMHIIECEATKWAGK